MMKLGVRHGKACILQKGQGLVEYSLILVLVAVVVIVITAVLGEDVRTVYCEVVQDINSDIDAPFCPGTADSAADTDTGDDDDGNVSVTCNPSSGAAVSGTVAPSASVTDAAGDNDINHVSFSVSGPGVSYSWTEYQVVYCAFHGDGPCDNWVNRSGSPLNSGSYSMSVTAYDDEGHTGSCSTSFTVSP